MARLVLTDAYVAFGSSDISDYITSVSLNTTYDVIETTAFGDTARKRVAGLADNSITIEFQADFASGALEQIIYQSQATNTLGTTVYMEVRPTSNSVTATNPKYTFNALVSEYPILNGAVGELATGSVTWPISGAITKATS
jgi:hypothetical protein